VGAAAYFVATDVAAVDVLCFRSATCCPLEFKQQSQQQTQIRLCPPRLYCPGRLRALPKDGKSCATIALAAAIDFMAPSQITEPTLRKT
jgi:hypothetical protein